MIRFGFLKNYSSVLLVSVWMDWGFFCQTFDGRDLNNSTIIDKCAVLLPDNQSIGHSFISIILIVFHSVLF